MAESYRTGMMGGCANGQCRSMRDVVARPSLYSGHQPNCPPSMQQQQQQQWQQQQALQQAQQRTSPQFNSHNGMPPAATFTPPPYAATAAYGYPQSSMYSGVAPPGQPAQGMRANDSLYPVSSMPQQQQQFQQQQQQQQQHATAAAAVAGTGTGKQQLQTLPVSCVPFEAIGLLVCCKCFAENRRMDQGDVRDAAGNVIEEGCAKTCVFGGSPVGVFDFGTGKVTLLLTRSPTLAPLMLNQTLVRVRGRMCGVDVAHGGAVLVETVEADPSSPSQDGRTIANINWVKVLERQNQQ